MLPIDVNTQERWRKEEAQRASEELRRRTLAEHLRKATVAVEDDAGRDVSSVEGQMGRPMAALDLIGKLKKCNPKLEFVKHPTFPLYGIYLRDNDAPKLEFKHHKSFRGRHICGMESEISPEFSILHKKQKAVPDAEALGNPEPRRELDWRYVETFAAETRGWRTVIIRLLHAGLITQFHVDKYFGVPSKDSRKWKEAIS